MASQFAHIETYAISPSTKSARGSSRGIFGELKRQPGFCDHVVVPKNPVVIFDVERGHKPCARPSLWIQQAEFRCVENAKLATVSCINGKSRKLRKDTAIVRVDVHSYPVPNAEVEPSDPTLNAWMQDVIDHVRAEVGTMGGRVEIAVGHFDEAYPHLHIVSTHPLRQSRPYSSRLFGTRCCTSRGREQAGGGPGLQERDDPLAGWHP